MEKSTAIRGVIDKHNQKKKKHHVASIILYGVHYPTSSLHLSSGDLWQLKCDLQEWPSNAYYFQTEIVFCQKRGQRLQHIHKARLSVYSVFASGRNFYKCFLLHVTVSVL